MTEKERLIKTITGLLKQINDLEVLRCIYLLALRMSR